MVLDEFRKSLEPFTMEYAAKTCGVPIETLERVAREIAAADTMCVLWAMGITQHTSASDGSTAISNLLLVTGNYMRPGCRSLSAARPQQRAGCQRYGSHAEQLSRLSERDRSSDSRKI